MTYTCGEKPGIGRYVCTNCGEDLYLDNSNKPLPPCSRCGKCNFEKD